MSDVLYDLDYIPILRALSDQAFDTKQWFDLGAAANELSLTDGFDRLLSLEDLSIQLFEHQRKAVLRVLREMRGRAVLADEVGLGKTIEAGVILREYMVRGLVSRVLILVPALLVNQWRNELQEKFRIHAAVAVAPSDWQRHDVIVASLDRAKRSPHAANVLAKAWDLVIVDEAHHLKDRASKNWQLVNGLKKKYLLLLTATPVQNDLRELYNLITLLKPGHLMTYSEFCREFTIDRHSPKNLKLLRQRLDEVMVRTSRRETLLRFPKRRIHSWSAALRGAERRFYNRLVDVLRAAYQQAPKRERNILPFILILRAASSLPQAAVRTLHSMTRRGTLPGVDTEHVSELAEMATELIPAKFTLCRRLLREDLRGENVIVYTNFRSTLRRLGDALEDLGKEVHRFHGGLSDAEKASVIDRFRRHGGVLISTETGSEGMNLQFCRCLINYDLPWNPLRLEQRIGRIHRLGQENDVRIDNLAAEGTVEGYILYLLERKIAMFDQVIGELESILGNFADSFEQRVVQAFLAADDFETTRRHMERLGQELKAAVQMYGRQRSFVQQLFQPIDV